jgi:hypothetical protein
MVEFLHKTRDLNLRKPPSISEALDWAQVLSILNTGRLTPEIVGNTGGSIIKHQNDMQKVMELAEKELIG